MQDYRTILNLIWDQHYQVGVTDDLMIIEDVAQLLLPTSAQVPDSIKFRETRLRPDGESYILNEIQIAGIAEPKSKADFFDGATLFRLPRMQAGGQYPTPRHIVETVIRISGIEARHSLADFACGSGGFLVHRPKSNAEETGASLGVDISEEWARLAWTNAVLHELPNTQVISADAFSGGIDPLGNNTFDRILMNPPFGHKLNPSAVANAIGQKIGSNSETAFTALALNKLNDDAVMAVLLPPGLLSNSAAGETNIRHQVVDENHLLAVIALPNDAFQPYSSIRAHLLVAKKGKPASDTTNSRRTWFLLSDRDGYSSGRSRDLTKEPDRNNSDLPLIESVMLWDDNTFHVQFPKEGDNKLLGLHKLLDVNTDDYVGFIVDTVGDAQLSLIEQYDPITDPPFVLVDVLDAAKQVKVTVKVLTESGGAQEVPDRDKEIRDALKLRKIDDIPRGAILFQGVKQKQAVAIAKDGRLMGLTATAKDIADETYDLRPDSYVVRPEPVEEKRPPANIVADIHRNLRALSRRVDSLLGRVELAPIADEDLPPRLLSVDAKEIEMIELLSKEQESAWKIIQKQINKEENTPLHFIPEDVEPGKGEVTESTRSTLDLLEKMGVIVSVTVQDKRNKPVGLYRRVTKRDLWDVDIKQIEEEFPGEEELPCDELCMKLRKLYLGDYRVLRELNIEFDPAYSAENVYQRSYAIDLLVGVNGTGKSTVMKAVAKIFSALYKPQYLDFDFDILYDVARDVSIRVCLLPEDPSATGGEEPKHVRYFINGKEVSSLGKEHLPKRVLIFTTGNEAEWEQIATTSDSDEGNPEYVKALDSKQRAIRELPGLPTKITSAPETTDQIEKKVVLIRSEHLPIVALCGVLSDLSGEGNRRLTRIYREANIGSIRGFSLRFRMNTGIASNNDRAFIERLAAAKGVSRRLKLGSDYLLLFEMQEPQKEIAESILGGLSPFEFYERLVYLASVVNGGQRVLQQVNLFLERDVSDLDSRIKKNVEQPPLHLWEWLSDGERSFIGRMSLFMLLGGQESLILLDEPEVHFNDYWKRQIVYLLDDVLQEEKSHVLISSHSSITLTDVPREDILVLERDISNTSRAINPPLRTFAADPSEIMVHVFGAPQAAGQSSVDRIQRALGLEGTERRGELEKLQQIVGPGYWSYRIRRELLKVGTS